MSAAAKRPFTWAEWAALDGVALAAHVRRRQVSAEEVAAQAGAALRWADARLAALVEIFPAAVRGADDAALGNGRLAGVPIVLKDLGSALAGALQEQGSALYRGQRATQTDPLVANLLAAGVSILGRSACAELGMSYDTTTDYRGLRVTRNPWNARYSPGGSSGGSAAVVAAGALPIAHGSDGAGSIRIPAALTGLIGLKVSRGRLPPPLRGNEYGNPGMVEGFLTRSVRDAAAAIDAAAAAMPAGCGFVPPAAPWPSLLDALAHEPPALRIGVSTGAWGRPAEVPAEAIAAVRAVAERLASDGHAVDEVGDDAIADWSEFWPGFLSFWVGVRPTWWPAGDAAPGAIARRYRAAADAYDKAAVLRHAAHVKRSSLKLGALFARFDLLLTPTLGCAAPLANGRLSGCVDRDFEGFIGDLLDAGRYAILANETGLPAISIPAGVDGEGVPVGVQLHAPWHHEHRLLQLARTLLPAPGAAHRTPAVHLSQAR